MNKRFGVQPGRIAVMTRRNFLLSASVATAAWPWIGRGADSGGRLKAAVIGHTGHGDYGHGLDSIFQNRSNIELVALADPDPAGRAKTAAKIKAPRAYADYRELLEKERPNLVSIAMRQADSHHAIAMAALRAGAHVYCEKPFARSPVEADEILAEAAMRARRVAVAHTMRMTPVIVRLKAALAEGMFGDLVELRAHGKQDARSGGEDMMVLGSHLFDLMRLLAGDPISCTARVTSQGRDITTADRRLVKDDVGYVAGDAVFAQFEFPRGVHATFTSNAALRDTLEHWGIEVLGSKGAARINCDIEPNVFVRNSTEWGAQGRTDSWKPIEAAALKSAPPQNAGPVGDWLEAIAANREPECSGRNGAWAVEMVMAVYQAALGATRVRFPLATRTHPLAG